MVILFNCKNIVNDDGSNGVQIFGTSEKKCRRNKP